ncbi:MAG: type II toxin-antitoxin system VapC family toxin [bacterium]|nr:type II toxin-antitoxin system VapC family toxin [bacterium]
MRDRLPLLPFDRNVAETYAALQAEFVQKGRTRSIFALFIAPTARAHKFIPATCNSRDVQNIPGVTVEDWSH